MPQASTVDFCSNKIKNLLERRNPLPGCARRKIRIADREACQPNLRSFSLPQSQFRRCRLLVPPCSTRQSDREGKSFSTRRRQGHIVLTCQAGTPSVTATSQCVHHSTLYWKCSHYVHHYLLTFSSLILTGPFAPEKLPSICRNGAGLHGNPSAHSEYVPLVRGPLDDKYILGLVLKQRKHLILAGGEPSSLHSSHQCRQARVQPSAAAQHVRGHERWL